MNKFVIIVGGIEALMTLSIMILSIVALVKYIWFV
jgi:hypothetical protein